MKILEWLFSFFFSKRKIKETKDQAFLEQSDAVRKYNDVKKANQKFRDKYSGKKRFVKVPSE